MEYSSPGEILKNFVFQFLFIKKSINLSLLAQVWAVNNVYLVKWFFNRFPLSFICFRSVCSIKFIQIFSINVFV